METAFNSRFMTAEEYGRLPEDGRLTDLVRGRTVEVVRRFTSHGYLMGHFSFLLGSYVEKHELGRIVCGNAGVVTQRDPDAVRGPDVAFYSYERIPRGPLPEGYWPESPELVIEIRSKDDRWTEVYQKVGEYLGANVQTVAVVDPDTHRVHLLSAYRETKVLNSSDQLTFPDILPGFEITVATLFE